VPSAGEGTRLDDGGRSCEAERGSVRSSFDTTINVLGWLLEFERATGGSDEVLGARRSGEEHLLERGLLRRLSSGEVVDPSCRQFVFPHYWHYDVLRALDYFRASGTTPDPRMAETVELAARGRNGTWPSGQVHPGRVFFDLEGDEGTPSRRNTLRALRVLAWWGAAA